MKLMRHGRSQAQGETLTSGRVRLLPNRGSAGASPSQAGVSVVDNCRDRHAFTLLELLIAISLATVLLGALYSAMAIYWTTAIDSHEEIERAQIVRALMREFARDIRSCTFVEQDLSDSSEEDAEDVDAVDAETALSGYTNGLFGTSKDLVLYISRPDRNQEYVPAAELAATTDRSSDAMIIRYLLADEAGTGLASQIAAENPEAVDDSVKGLAVMSGDLTGLSNAISLGDVDIQLEASTLVAPEVGDVSFRYFDGVDELEEWDSTVQNAMPLAVIVELTLRTLPDPGDPRDQESAPGFLAPTVHRLVVPIPVATPYVEEFAL